MKSIDERAIVVKQLFEQINKPIKAFILDVAKDLGLPVDKLYVKIEATSSHYSLNIFNEELQQTVCYHFLMEDFLKMCVTEGQLEHRMNKVVRQMFVSFGTTKDDLIVLG